ncbi:ribonuclease HII [Helicobacter sp. 23-1044]
MEICGIDEAGRGCIAGSLFVCGVVCDEAILREIAGLNDSKKIIRKKRDEIYKIALSWQIPHFVAKFSAKSIDEKGISKCIANALAQIIANLPAQKYIFDGNTSFGVRGVECVIKGDSKIPQISLASIIAKSLKDKECDELHKIYPQWGFEAHKGYGTKEHIKAIKAHGFSAVHRRSFKIKELDSALF